MEGEEQGGDQKPKSYTTCGAKTRNGGTCQKPPLAGRNRCRLHGGMSLRGVAHPNYQGKGYSKDLPANLRGRYEQFLSDKDLHTLEFELAVAKALAADAFKALGSGSSADCITEIGESWLAVEAAMKSGDAAAAQSALAEHGRRIAAAGDFRSARDDAFKVMQEVARLASLEQRRKKDEKHLLSIEQVQLMLGSIARIILENVDDAKVRQRIAMEFARLMGRAEGKAGAASGTSIAPAVAQGVTVQPPDRNHPGACVAGDGRNLDSETISLKMENDLKHAAAEARSRVAQACADQQAAAMDECLNGDNEANQREEKEDDEQQPESWRERPPLL